MAQYECDEQTDGRTERNAENYNIDTAREATEQKFTDCN